jgi:hypothetical protein
LRPLSRAIIILLKEAWPGFEHNVMARVKKEAENASVYLPKLLHITQDILDKFEEDVASTSRLLRPLLDGTTLKDAKDRVSRNWAIIWHALLIVRITF